MNKKRKVLIVEDDSGWQNHLKDLCSDVLRDLHNNDELKELYLNAFFDRVEGYMIQGAANLQEAQKLLYGSSSKQSKKPALADDYFCLVTVDLNLSDAVPGSEQGLELLEWLDRAEVTTVVVSAIAKQRAKEILRKYRTFTYVDKDEFKADIFKRIVKAAILYDDALKLLDTNQRRCIKVAQEIWGKVHEIGLDSELIYRRTVTDRIHPNLGIPNTEWTNEVLRTLLDKEDNWAVLSIAIRGLDQFSIENSPAVPGFVAKELKSAVDELGNADDFPGCGDPDKFVLITTPDKLDVLRWRIESRFKQKVRLFYRASDSVNIEGNYVEVKTQGQTRREPLLRLLFAQITHEDERLDSLDAFKILRNERWQAQVDGLR